jgi:hypothetical protein
MSRQRQGEAHPFQALEQEAFHAYREWHLWLVLRERELSERLAVGRTDQHPPGAASAGAGTERNSTSEKGNP